jgi:hypothetical protein
VPERNHHNRDPLETLGPLVGYQHAKMLRFPFCHLHINASSPQESSGYPINCACTSTAMSG